MSKQDLSELNRNRTIPIFDCLYEFDEHLEFYTALGFEIVYYQKSPYRFATVKSDFTEISFFGDKKFNPHGKQGGCYIVVPDIELVYNQLKANIKKHYGKIPTKGLPRISRLNLTTEDRRCNITDPSGNTLIIGEALGDSTTLMQEEADQVTSKFEKSYKLAYRLAYSKEDFPVARNLLEYAFNKQSDNISTELQYKAKVLQIDVFVSLGRIEIAKEIFQDLDSIKLSTDEQIQLQNEIQRFLELKEEIFV
ncbi:hypothetical protein [Bacillus sp. JJ722]|uniref:hypothetical protein n=1 Tax=Bacillus sp. JJ722 TaxID=3122973 RepID=UPI002FFFDC37